MSPRAFLRFGALLFCNAAGVFNTRAASPPVAADSQMLQGATTYQIVVVQTSTAPSSLELPFVDVLSAFLDAAGLHAAPKGAVADIVLHVNATGEALARDYDNLFRPDTKTHAFSGADLSGRCSVARKGKEREAFTFDRQWSPPDTIVKEYPKPEDAPFIEPFGEFVFRAADWAGRALGVKPLLIVLGSDPYNALNTAVPQLQIAAAEAAAKYGGSAALPAMRARLADGGPLQRAAAARGLRLAEDRPSLPDLVALLNEDEKKLNESDNTGWSMKVVDLEDAVEAEDNEDGVYDAGVEILAAVSALYRPTDRKLLLEALADRESVMRRINAAIVLGRARDRGALEPLVVALKDEQILVRSAAASALGAIGDAHAIPALKALAKADDGNLDVTAAQSALEALSSAKRGP